jgi:hypothetical protein
MNKDLRRQQREDKAKSYQRMREEHKEIKQMKRRDSRRTVRTEIVSAFVILAIFASFSGFLIYAIMSGHWRLEEQVVGRWDGRHVGFEFNIDENRNFRWTGGGNGFVRWGEFGEYIPMRWTVNSYNLIAIIDEINETELYVNISVFGDVMRASNGSGHRFRWGMPVQNRGDLEMERSRCMGEHSSPMFK